MEFLLESFGVTTLIVFAVLAVLSFFALTVSLFKIGQFWRLGLGDRKTADGLIDQWLEGRRAEAIADASNGNSVLARVLHSVFKGLQARPGEPEFAEELGRQTAVREMAAMTHRMRVLEVVVQAAPMLGLLGTVIGMIDAFSVLASSATAVDPTSLARGIQSALYTTAIGLSVAVVTYIIANFFDGKIDKERNLMEISISAAVHGRVDPGAGQR